jgi:hypothetical protein
MVICIQVKKKMILDMVKENIYMVMVVIIMGIGLKGKWKVKVNYMIQMEIYNMKGNGKMIIMMVKEYYTV